MFPKGNNQAYMDAAQGRVSQVQCEDNSSWTKSWFLEVINRIIMISWGYDQNHHDFLRSWSESSWFQQINHFNLLSAASKALRKQSTIITAMTSLLGRSPSMKLPDEVVFTILIIIITVTIITFVIIIIIVVIITRNMYCLLWLGVAAQGFSGTYIGGPSSWRAIPGNDLIERI